jgi:hypothetical protein
VGDEHHPPVGGDEAAELGEQLLDFGGGEHGGRLIQDQQPHPAGQAADDLQPLAQRQRQFLDPLAGVDVHRQGADDRRQRHPGPLRGAVAHPTQTHVLGHAQPADQQRVLVDHADA